ncbi:puromycin-sensitive aminopeptidase-like [Babylonia areolata]|uniref:puromycin-sensitive aminopeptidase-like n=1 Tax=Babylonia areolata TaxID=304850 RepID=UPI003FD1FA42
MTFTRLTTTVVPVNYKLQLQPYLDEKKFQGEEIITLEVKETTDRFVIHAQDLQIELAELEVDNDRQCPRMERSAPEADSMTLIFANPLKQGVYKLHLKFEGTLNDELRGFYRTTHKLLKGEERNGALTHFEATGARRAFPCFDEPAIRATFDITLIVPGDRVALSNMPVKSERTHKTNGWKVVKFQTTPPMPTYLVAFVVGDYHRADASDQDGVKVRVFTPPGKGNLGMYAARLGATMLPFYKEYFGIPYNLPKLDLVAAPDFPIGAMENWGLVIYREAALLVDFKKSSLLAREYVALIVAHELAHNWFGNLVTMEWWTHLWLKEGFASWIEYLCVDYLFPNFDVWTQFVSMDLGRALKLDALESSHPIEIEVGNPAEIDEIFDAISYSKGASIINMLHDYIGDEDFRKGLKLYLKRHKFGSACTQDLWKALEEASGKVVGTVMATWTSQKGFPVLKVTERQTSDGECVLDITQQKFSVSLGQQSGEGSLWVVPISILTESGTEVKKVLMENRNVSVTLDVEPDEWVKVNAGTKGVYRVHYSADMLTKLVPWIENQQLQPTDRLGIISDLFALCEVGLVSSVELLNVVKAFTGETNFTVWRDLLANLCHMGQLLQYHTGASALFRRFLCSLLQQVYAKIGWEWDEESDRQDHGDSRLRDIVVSTLGACGEKSVVDQAFTAFYSHVEYKQAICSNMRKAVYSTVMAHGKAEVYFKLKKLMQDPETPHERITIMGCFGRSQDTAILQDALKLSVSGEVKSQDTHIIVGGVAAGSAKGRELAWAFFKDNYQMLYHRFSSSLLLARLVKVITEDFASEEMAVEIEQFFKEHPAPSAERTVQQSCEKIRLNAVWLQQEAENVTKYLKENPLPPPPSEGQTGKQDRKPVEVVSSGVPPEEFASDVVVTVTEEMNFPVE